MITFSLQGSVASPVPVTVEAVTLASKRGDFDITGLTVVSGHEATSRVHEGLRAAEYAGPAKRLHLLIGGPDILSGTGHDLAIAVAFLVQSQQIPKTTVEGLAFWGDISGSGSIRAVRGTLAAAVAAQQAGLTLCTAPGPAADAAVRLGIPVVTLNFLGSLRLGRPAPHTVLCGPSAPLGLDMGDVRGQSAELFDTLVHAAATRTPLLLRGPPGCGATMLAARLPGILPFPEGDEARAIATRSEAAGLSPVSDRPFRAPHDTVSAAGLAGSRTALGEVDLAIGGVLFLDVVTAFSRGALEALGRRLEELGADAPWVVMSTGPHLAGGKEEERELRALRILGLTPVLVELERPFGALALQGALQDMPRGPSSAELRSKVGLRMFDLEHHGVPVEPPAWKTMQEILADAAKGLPWPGSSLGPPPLYREPSYAREKPSVSHVVVVAGSPDPGDPRVLRADKNRDGAKPVVLFTQADADEAIAKIAADKRLFLNSLTVDSVSEPLVETPLDRLVSRRDLGLGVGLSAELASMEVDPFPTPPPRPRPIAPVIVWTPLVVETPPQRTLVILAGCSGHTHHPTFLTLGYYDEAYRPRHGGPIRWLHVHNTPLSDAGWTPTHWAPAPNLPPEAP